MTKLSFPKEAIQIVLFEGISQTAVDYLTGAGYSNVTLLDRSMTGAELSAQVAEARMIGIRSRTQITEEVLEQAPKLMAVGCFCIGTNQVDLPAAARRGVPVFNAPHSNTRSVAELVMAEMVMLLRGIVDKSAAAHRGEWHKSASNAYELRGKTLGIVGYGHIGSQVSILAEAFGMKVLYNDVIPKLPMGNAIQVDSLDEMLPQCDFVTFHVPAAPDTVNLMNGTRIAKLKDGACLMNLSRGNVVDIEVLAAELAKGRLLGAAVDVFPKEPKSTNETFSSPLQGKPNVILTPHIGGSTQEAQQNIGKEVATKLVSYSDNGSTMSAVNFPNISLAANEEAHRILHIHENRPGVLTALNTIFSEGKANILGQHLQTSAELGYVVTDLDKEHDPDLLEKLKAVDGTIKARILY